MLFAGCPIDEGLGPPPPNFSGPVTSGSPNDGSESASETDESGPLESETDESETADMGECDPLQDPLRECGPAMRCDPSTLTCIPANGAGLLHEICIDDDDCSPELVCHGERCRSLCSPSIPGEQDCDNNQLCTVADAPLPGLCLDPCSLLLPECSVAGDACKRALGPGDEPTSACVPNPGAGVDGDACSSDGDCSPGYLCTLASTHTEPCFEGAMACCTPLCDTSDLPCFGIEPICHELGIPDQPSAGYCGN
jgi:hypothetical protein